MSYEGFTAIEAQYGQRQYPEKFQNYLNSNLKNKGTIFSLIFKVGAKQVFLYFLI